MDHTKYALKAVGLKLCLLFNKFISHINGVLVTRKRYNNERSEKRVPEGLLCEKLHILLTEGTSGSCGELGVESVCHLGPDHLLGYSERHATRLREGVVPCHGGPGVRLLVAVHNHHHWQRQCPHLNSLLCH